LPIGSKTMLDDIVLNFNGFKKTNAAATFTAQWNSTFSQLSITPQGLIGSAQYSLDMRNVFNSGKITDAAGNALVNNTKLVGDFELLNFTTSGSSIVPSPPNVTRKFVQGTYNYLDYNGGAIELEWNYDANARSYRVYKSVNNGAFVIDAKDVYAIQYTENTGSLVVPLNATSPLSSGSVRYQVTVVSKDLVESSPSSIITVTDQVSPQLLVVNPPQSVGGSNINNWAYLLPFSEPLVVSTAEYLANYSFINTDTVIFTPVEADYLGYNANDGRYYVKLFAGTDLPFPNGYSVKVGSGVTDLAGNAMDNAASAYVFTPPPVPVLVSPADGATGVSPNPTLSWKKANGATSYHLQISAFNTFVTTVYDNSKIVGTSAAVPASNTLTSGVTYYWRVSATDDRGSSVYSAARSFTVQ